MIERQQQATASTSRQLVTTFCQHNNSIETTTTTTTDDINQQRGPQQCCNDEKRLDRFSATNGKKERKYSLEALLHYNSHVGSRIQFALSLLLGANILISAMNTVLLSFLVKSTQTNDLSGSGGGGGGKLIWNELSATTDINLPASLVSGKSIYSSFIESYGQSPLVIGSLPAKYRQRRRPISSLISTGDTTSPASNLLSAAVLDEEVMASGQPIIITSPVPFPPEPNSFLARERSEANKNFNSNSNYIAINPSYSPSLPLSWPANSALTGAASSMQMPVEIATNSFVLNSNRISPQLKATTTNTEIASSSPSTGNGRASKRAERQQTLISPAQSERLLELDGEQQSITLPLLGKLEMSSTTANSLIVNGELRSDGSGGISGTMEENFDLQARNGNLTCRSLDNLRMVSKSASLRLVARRRLSLSTPALHFSVPTTNKLYVPNGIKFFDNESPQPPLSKVNPLNGANTGAEAAEDNLTNGGLRAYNLVLLDGLLMAS